MEALGERRIDIACVQEIRWRGSSCRYFGATGKRYKLFWMGTTTCSGIKGSMSKVAKSFICRGCLNPVTSAGRTSVDIGASAKLGVSR